MMDKWIDLGMTKLFQLAEYVCSRCSLSSNKPAAPQDEVVSIIRFTKEDKAAIKQGIISQWLRNDAASAA